MKHRYGRLFLLPMLALSLLLAGCAVRYSGGEQGIYYQDSYPTYPVRTATVNPYLYPWWSLDYFYFSHYYHPYSVFELHLHPWYYPYPGWYFGSLPARRHLAGHGQLRYPWYNYRDLYQRQRPQYEQFGRSTSLPFADTGALPPTRAISQRLQLIERASISTTRQPRLVAPGRLPAISRSRSSPPQTGPAGSSPATDRAATSRTARNRPSSDQRSRAGSRSAPPAQRAPRSQNPSQHRRRPASPPPEG